MKKSALILTLLLALALSGCTAAPAAEPSAASTAKPPIAAPTLDALLASEQTARESLALLAALPEHNIALYSLEIAAGWAAGIEPVDTGHQGMLLYQDGFGTAFSWPSLTPRAVLPQLAYRDFDGDGQAELLACLHVGSGSGVSIDDLYVLKVAHDSATSRPLYTEAALLGDAASQWFDLPIENLCLSANGAQIDFTLLGKDYSAPNPYAASLDPPPQGITLGNVVSFELTENGIGVTAALQVEHPDMMPHAYIGQVTAALLWDGERFALADYSFSANE